MSLELIRVLGWTTVGFGAVILFILLCDITINKIVDFLFGG